jgi:hypothetical protein
MSRQGNQQVEFETRMTGLHMTKRTQLGAFAFLCGASILLWWHSLTATLRLALGNEACTHVLLIMALSAAPPQVLLEDVHGELGAHCFLGCWLCFVSGWFAATIRASPTGSH